MSAVKRLSNRRLDDPQLFSTQSHPAFQLGQNFHIAVKTGRAERKVFTDRSMNFFLRVLRHPYQFPVVGTTNPPRVRKSFGQIRFGEA